MNFRQHGSHVNVEIWTFLFIFIFNLPGFPFFAPFVSSLIIASNKVPYYVHDWTGPDGSETDETDMGNLPCYQVPFLR